MQGIKTPPNKGREKNWLFVVIVIVIEQFVNDINSTVGILSSDASLSMFSH
jgi:hypothetical protein